MTAENEREIYHKLEAMKEIRYVVFHLLMSIQNASHLWTRINKHLTPFESL